MFIIPKRTSQVQESTTVIMTNIKKAKTYKQKDNTYVNPSKKGMGQLQVTVK